MLYLQQKFSGIFRPNSGVTAFFTSIIVWGIGIGAFAASLNNYLVEIHSVDELGRGWIEFFREFSGLTLIFTLALLHRISDWRILRIGTIISMVGMVGFLFPTGVFLVAAFITIWSLGEHLIMPIRSSIALTIANSNRGGTSLGLVTSTINLGTIIGSFLVAMIFWVGGNYLGITERASLYRLVWILILILLAISLWTTFTKFAPRFPSKRPRFYFNKKFNKFYILELFYGGRKQIFLTFGPYVLIIVYKLTTVEVAILVGISACINMVFGPLIGRITDHFGYRKIMIYDTIILAFVCLVYGYADKMFTMKIAVYVVCVNYLLDHLLSTASLATNLYAKEISANGDEFTSTLATGLSVNHLISVTSAPLGGWIWQSYGVGVLFSFAAIMAICNSFFAWTLPRCHADKNIL